MLRRTRERMGLCAFTPDGASPPTQTAYKMHGQWMMENFSYNLDFYMLHMYYMIVNKYFGNNLKVLESYKIFTSYNL